jgi:hypothetical protein
MKWGVRKDRKKGGWVKRRWETLKQREHDKHKQGLIDDSKNVTAKAPQGKHMWVQSSRYMEKRYGDLYPAYHLVNDRGQVKMSYISGYTTNTMIAAGKDYVSKLDKTLLKNIRDARTEYDIYK